MLPFLFVLLLLTGCGPSKPTPISPEFKETRQIFLNRCMGCHNASFRPHGHSTNWLDESVVKERLDVLKERVIMKRNMPQGNTLTDKEYETIKDYLDKQIQAKNEDELILILLILGSM